MVRFGRKRRQQLRRAKRRVGETLETDQANYEPPDRDDCRLKRWETPYDDTNTVRLQFFLWQQSRRLVDFVVNVQILGAGGWTDVERFDCCHGRCHLHTKNREEEPRTILRLDDAIDVQHAFEQVKQEAHQRARIIRDEGT